MSEHEAIPSSYRKSIEAILMVVDEPVTEELLAQILEISTETVSETVQTLSESYEAEDRGFQLKAVAGGWRFYSHPDESQIVEKFVMDGQQSRLTQAALETLAVVAYRQPVSRARVSAIRGVNVEAVVKTLVTRGLIEERGSEPDTGGILYGTTSFFLEKLGIRSIEDIPALAPFLPDTDGLEEVLATLTE
jgi:segregation and condensation protein B